MFNNIVVATIWNQNKYQIAFIYLLNIIEEIFYLLIPSAVGMLIDTFIYKTGYGVWAFTVTYIGWQGFATIRKIRDTIVFTNLFKKIGLLIIKRSTLNANDTSTINARIELTKQIIAFFEEDLPFITKSIIAIIGSSILLYFYNPKLLLVSLVIIFPSLIANYFFGKRISKVTTAINSQYETQIEVIASGTNEEQQHYFNRLRQLNVKKSTLEAFNFGIIEIFVFFMILISIYIICTTSNMNYGSIVASYGIVLRFAYGFDFIPHATTKLVSLKDIIKRIDSGITKQHNE